MRIAVALSAAFIATATVLAVNWQQQLSPPPPGTFPQPRPMHISYKFGWGLIAAGEAEADLSLTNAGLLRLDVKGKTTGAVRALWSLDGDGTALCRPETLRPVSAVQTEVYRDAAFKTTLDFDAKGVKRTRQKKGSERVKTKRVDFPNLFDMPTAMLWLRSQRLQVGDIYRCLVYPDSSTYFTEMEVIGREKCKIAEKCYNAIKLALRLQTVNRKRELEAHSKFKRAFAWLSDDADRLLLKVDAEVFVGSVWMEIDKVEFRSGAN